MKKTTANGVFETREIIETTPDDGLVSEKTIRPASIDTQGKHRIGHSKTFVYTTNNPKIAGAFAYGFCALWFLIGIFLFQSDRFHGIIVCALSIAVFFSVRKSTTAMAKRIKEMDQNSTDDPAKDSTQ